MFHADDVRQLFAQHHAPVRGEFETSAEFSARVSRLPAPKAFAVRIDMQCTFRLSYDADAAEFTVAYDLFNPNGAGVQVLCINRNAYNTFYSLSLPGMAYGDLPKQSWVVPMPVARARVLRSTLRLLAVGSISVAPTAEAEGTRWIERSLPVVGLSVWLYDSATGEVFSKHSLTAVCPANPSQNCLPQAPGAH